LRVVVLGLVPHPGTPCRAVQNISVHASRDSGGIVALRYSIEGTLARLRIPAPRAPAFADLLWQHTCCEAFIRRPGSVAYEEFNASLSGEWAAYSFSGYRQGAVRLDAPVEVHLERNDTRLLVEAVLHVNSDQALDVALSAVIEEDDGVLSYWALKHPSGTPDFHHPEAFALRLDEVRH
jgi:hypothetical protein